LSKMISFIINPASGTGRQAGIEQKIKRFLHPKAEYEILHTKARFHAKELAEEALKKSKLIVAVGGDGTVNEIAGALINSEAVLGIIPAGSGNGIARNANIPTDIEAAIKLLNNHSVLKFDAGFINGRMFLATAGCGFDAHISERFSLVKKRGFYSYAKIVLREFNDFKPLRLTLEQEGTEHEVSAFMATAANGKQFGNNAFIAPGASITDGKLNLTIVRPFPFYAAPLLALRLFTGRMIGSTFVKTYEAPAFTIKHNGNIAHCDGDFFECEEILKFSIKPGAINLAVPNI
jgi:diacylglycerol kinase (ATP)